MKRKVECENCLADIPQKDAIEVVIDGESFFFCRECWESDDVDSEDWERSAEEIIE